MRWQTALASLATLTSVAIGAATPPVPRWSTDGTDKTPRLTAYAAYFHENQNEGPYTALLPILQNNSGITDVVLFVCDLHEDEPHLTVGGEAPDNTTFLGPLWDEVNTLQAGGINVLAGFGGYGANNWLLLQDDFDFYYPKLRSFLQTYNLHGIDLDIEPSLNTLSIYASGESVVKLLKQLRKDFGPNFLITMAPVAQDLTSNPPYFSGIGLQTPRQRYHRRRWESHHQFLQCAVLQWIRVL